MTSNDQPSNDGVQGEGDYEAARRYDRDQREFVQSGRVDQAARDQGVLAAEQQPLDDGVDPGHVAKPPDLGRVPSPK